MIIQDGLLYTECPRCDGGKITFKGEAIEGEGGTITFEVIPCTKCRGLGVIKIDTSKIRTIPTC